MYLISFLVSYLDIFDVRLAFAVKRLSHMAKSSRITDMLINQGLQNIHLLQGSTRTQFLLSALEAPDIHCKLTYRYCMHEHLKPFLQKALKARQTVCRSPLALGKQGKLTGFSLQYFEEYAKTLSKR
jgi:hypothetical protein